MQFLHWNFRQEGKGSLPTDPKSLPAFAEKVLVARGVENVASATHFLACDEPLHDPMLLLDIQKAVEIVEETISQGKKILVFGDYDCDGITATVMLYDYLENAGADVCYYIPERVSEGYGLSMEAVKMVKTAGIDLIITVDNGISSVEEVQYAKEQGIKVIITDHHALAEQLPAADAVINPNRPDSEYPFRQLCGAGVAFKLISALEQCNQGGEDVQDILLEQYGDLLVIGTLADVVPLVGENRCLARRGLAALSNTTRLGLLALAEVSKTDLSLCTSETVSFILAPRINVTGRIGSVDMAVRLLLCNEEAEAIHLAEEINALNTKRREMEEQISAETTEIIMKKPSLLWQRVLTIVGDDWHLGVIGITASRMVDRYRKPCVIISCKDGIARGSCRSVEGFSIIEAIAACGEYLIKFGGHPMAAGFSLKEENIPVFCEALEQYAREHFPIMPVHTLKIDTQLNIEELTLPNVESLLQLAPFGCANPQPVFLLPNVRIQSVTAIGNGHHLRLSVSSGRGTVSIVCFGTTVQEFPFAVGDNIDIACGLSVNEYNDQRSVSVRALNVRPAGFDDFEKLRDTANFESLMRGETVGEGLPAFTRSDLATIFRFLREKGSYARGNDALHYELAKTATHFSYFNVLAALQIMQELGLITKNNDAISIVETKEKADLNNSPTYNKLQS